MAQLIDRRPNAKNKSTVNRQRFLRRYRKQIKEAISEQISKRSITDVDGSESVSIPTRDISEPTFRKDKGGVQEGVYPGNKEFAQGDRIKRPINQGQGSGRRASDSGEGEDEFAFEISRDEYLDMLFDDLELPNLKKNQLRKMTRSKTVRAGFTNDGVPTNINIVRSLRSSLSRRVAMGAEPRRQLRELEAELEALQQQPGTGEVRSIELQQEIEALRSRLRKIPFIDTFDLRFNNYVQRPEPTAQAVMFCLMDVSGSMDQQTKDIAKRFYILLYLFLTRSYRDVDVVYIRHHTSAREVDEEEFFYSRETGGTIVSSALELTRDIVAQRYPPGDWNIYAAQASDGDNWNDDSPRCQQLLAKDLLPQLRYYAYVEITRRDHQGLWDHYAKLLDGNDNFAMQQIRETADIYPVFREFFREAGPMREPISTGAEWTFELIEQYHAEIAAIAEEFKLDTYPNQIELITAEQMLDAYASIGMPIGYSHWSFGKHFIRNEQQYRRGRMGLAYEIVINSNPCIAYLMEENTMMMQALVIAHACFGHNSFFKGNYLFRTWTDAEAIIDYLVFARRFISDCEERYGIEEVENLLDSCHALQNHGVDRYKRPSPISMREEQERLEEREAYLQSQVNDLWLKTVPQKVAEQEEATQPNFPEEPQENILYFIEKNAPLLEPWQREVVRIVRKIGQYFYPQRQTQVMNEGWACFWHYHLLNELYDRGRVTDGFMLEFLQSHTNVVAQPEFDSDHFSGINPYALGYAMMTDIKRICVDPDEEDRHWFPDLAGSDWQQTLDFAMRNFKDESFISQYLSPRLIREFKLFSILDDEEQDELEVTSIHNDTGYRYIRQALSNQYNLSMNEPNIQVYNVNIRGDRSLTLRHVPHNNVPLADTSGEVLRHLRRLWGFGVKLETIGTDGEVIATEECAT